MSDRPFNLAIETSSRQGSIALGRGDAMLAAVDLPTPRRHVVGLMPAIDRLCREHGCGPADLGEVFVSVGPGSFTGLRVGVTAAKMLGWALGARLVAVPTLDVVAENAPVTWPHLAVMLNAKGGRCFTGLYDRAEGRWRALGAATLMTPDEVCLEAPRPLAVIGDKLPPYDWPEDVQQLEAALARPRAAVAWRLGRALAQQEAFVGPYDLTPMYVRLPEAEEKRLAESRPAG